MEVKSKNINYTYMLRCSDDTFYIGWTNDIEKRVASHNQGKGGKYTSVRTPVTLVYYETHDTKQEAMSREWHMKKLTRRQKEALIESDSNEYCITV